MNSVKQVIRLLVNTIHTTLQELYEARTDSAQNDFAVGQIYAYVECLEILQLCPALHSHLLNYDIEQKFPLP